MPRSKYQIRLTEQRKADGVCLRCGGIIEDKRFKQCDKCREYDRDYKRLSSERARRAKHPRRVPESGLTISQVCRMAAERGISYGQMVVEIEKEGV